MMAQQLVTTRSRASRGGEVTRDNNIGRSVQDNVNIHNIHDKINSHAVNDNVINRVLNNLRSNSHPDHDRLLHGCPC